MTDNLSFADSSEEKYYKKQSVRAKKMLLYLAMFSIVMFFGGLTSAYLVLMMGEYWVNITVPSAFYFSTAVIVISSFTIKLAVNASKKGHQKKVQQMVVVTLLLGLVFAASQFYGWGQLNRTGNYVSGNISNLDGVYGEDYTIFFKGQELVLEDGIYYYPDDYQREEPLNERVVSKANTASSFIFVLSVTHLLHMLGGLIYLVYLTVKSYRVQIDASNNLSLKQGATYWHFLDILWVYLFLFLLIIH